MLTVIIKGRTPNGAYGRYVKLDNAKGVKILSVGFKTIHEVYNSEFWNEAVKEAEMLMSLETSGVTPKCYGVEIVEVVEDRNTFYSVGIIMEHLGDMTLNAAVNTHKILSSQDGQMHKKNLATALRLYGVKHGDFHEENIIYHEGRCFAIDFLPKFMHKVDKKIVTPEEERALMGM